MSVTVVTGFSPEGLNEYGWNFIKSFCENWPVEVMLVMYVEAPIFDIRLTPIDKFIGGKRRRVEIRLLLEARGCAEFIARHKDNPAACGTDVQSNWKERERDEGYNFRFDAVKFCRMAMFAADAARKIEPGRILVWLDGDVMTKRPVPENFVEGLIGDHEVCYLGREPKHPDTAFVAFQDEGLAVARHWGNIYEDDAVFHLPETHSAFVLRCVMKGMENLGLDALNLTPKGRGHVWFQSPLAQYMDHLKGQKRKRRGRSKEWK
jgi:hypothetical protein